MPAMSEKEVRYYLHRAAVNYLDGNEAAAVAIHNRMLANRGVKPLSPEKVRLLYSFWARFWA